MAQENSLIDDQVWDSEKKKKKVKVKEAEKQPSLQEKLSFKIADTSSRSNDVFLIL